MKRADGASYHSYRAGASRSGCAAVNRSSRPAYQHPGAVDRRRWRGRAEGVAEVNERRAGACSCVGSDALQLVEWPIGFF
jgi:hypothetical protein